MNKYVLIKTEVGRDTIINTFPSSLNKTELNDKLDKLLDELNHDNYYGYIVVMSNLDTALNIAIYWRRENSCIIEQGFSDNVITALVLLTKTKKQDYFNDYIIS